MWAHVRGKKGIEYCVRVKKKKQKQGDEANTMKQKTEEEEHDVLRERVNQ